MRKIFALMLAVLFVFCVSSAAMATQPENPGPGWYYKGKNPNETNQWQYFPNGHPGGNSEWTYYGPTPPTPPTWTPGNASISLYNWAEKCDWDFAWLNKGFSMGGSHAEAYSQLGAAGTFWNGELDLQGMAVAGAGAITNSWADYDFDFGYGTFRITAEVGTINQSGAVIANSLKMSGAGWDKYDSYWCYWCGWYHSYLSNDSSAYGSFGAYAKQGNFAVSKISLPNYVYDSKGSTGAIAGQSSEGSYSAWAGIGDTYWPWYYYGGAEFFQGGVELGASIEMIGTSGAISGRYSEVNFCDQTKTEGLYSIGFASTDVWSTITQNYTYYSGYPYGYVYGGWEAQGGVCLTATQTLADPVFVTASAQGDYNASGALGQNYHGSANGFVNTQITQGPLMNVAVSQAAMNVQSIVTGIPGGYQPN